MRASILLDHTWERLELSFKDASKYEVGPRLAGLPLGSQVAVSPGGSLGGQDWSQTMAGRAASSEIPAASISTVKSISGVTQIVVREGCLQVP